MKKVQLNTKISTSNRSRDCLYQLRKFTIYDVQKHGVQNYTSAL